MPIIASTTDKPILTEGMGVPSPCLSTSGTTSGFCSELRSALCAFKACSTAAAAVLICRAAGAAAVAAEGAATAGAGCLVTGDGTGVVGTGDTEALCRCTEGTAGAGASRRCKACTTRTGGCPLLSRWCGVAGLFCDAGPALIPGPCTACVCSAGGLIALRGVPVDHKRYCCRVFRAGAFIVIRCMYIHNEHA